MNDLFSLAKKLNNFNKDFKNKKYRLIIKNSIYTSEFLFLYYFISSDHFKNSPYRDILINYFKKSESMYPGSSYLTSVKFVEKVFNIVNKGEVIKTDKNLNNVFEYLKSKTNANAFELFKSILEFTGPDGTIICERTKNKEIHIEKKSLPEFKIQLHSEFVTTYFSKVHSTTKNVLFAVIDGFIERESELMPFLEKMKENKVQGVIVCRGISDTAAKHLKNIILKNRLYLYPYISKFDNNDPFLFQDLARISKTKLITSETMDVIYKEVTNKSEILKITLNSNKLIFHEKNTSLIEEINKQIKNCSSEAKSYLLKRRKRSMPNKTIVYMPENKNNLFKEISCLIKCYNISAIYGIEKINNNIVSKFNNEYTSKLSKSMYENIKNIGYSIKRKEK